MRRYPDVACGSPGGLFARGIRLTLRVAAANECAY